MITTKMNKVCKKIAKKKKKVLTRNGYRHVYFWICTCLTYVAAQLGSCVCLPRLLCFHIKL